jgi:hypothetical protein
MDVTAALATERQINYVKDLLHGRVVDPDAAARLRQSLAKGDLSKKAASDAIGWLVRQAKLPVAVAPSGEDEKDEAYWTREIQARERAEDEQVAADKAARDSALARVPVTEIGIYEVNDKIYRVKRSKRTNGLYASVLIYTVGEALRLTAAGSTIKAEYEYAPGALKFLSADDRVTGARAEELSIVFRSCIVCGRTLKAAKSVARSIGPVCFKKV